MSGKTLRSSNDFKRVMREGRRARRDGLTVYVAARIEGGPSRLGLAVRCDRAVDRNLLKRRLRSAWRSAGVAPGFDVAVRAGHDALGEGYQELETPLLDALAAAGVSK